MAMSAAHRAAISAGMKRYWASKKSGNSAGSSTASKTGKAAAKAIINIDNGQVISREEAAARMFGTKVAAVKLSKQRSRRRR